ncbi:MAG: hypothetical protein KGZ34_04485 [Nitrosarchaeum sp.]|nr:hypothetical protein [Nitrosarchaeum sp.]
MESEKFIFFNDLEEDLDETSSRCLIYCILDEFLRLKTAQIPTDLREDINKILPIDWRERYDRIK